MTPGAPEAVVRAATVADAPAIASLHVASWLSTYRGLMPDEILDEIEVEEWTTRRRALLEDETGGVTHRRSYVLEAGGVIRGFSGVGVVRDPQEDATRVGELMAIYLHPDWVGRGLGRPLWQRSLEDLRAHRHAEVIVWVLDRNARARRFYESVGFTEDGFEPKDFRSFALPHVRYRLRL